VCDFSASARHFRRLGALFIGLSREFARFAYDFSASARTSIDWMRGFRPHPCDFPKLQRGLIAPRAASLRFPGEVDFRFG